MYTRLTAFALVLLLSSFSFAQNIPSYYGWVNDFASVISPEIEREMTEKIQKYNDSTGIEIAVATVPSLQSYSVEEFSEKLFAAWGVGQKGKDNGVLLLIAPSQEERDLRIEVGYGLEGDLTDAQAGEILDECIIPHTKGRSDGWAKGASSGLSCLIAHLGTKTFQTRVEERRRASEMNWFIFKGVMMMITIVIILVAMWLWLRRRKRLKGVRRENDTKLTELQEKGEELSLRITEAEGVLEQLNRTNTPSLLVSYSVLLDGNKVNAEAITTQSISKLWEFHAQLKYADSVSSRISAIEKDIAEVRDEVLKIISLPALIQEKKKYVEENRVAILQSQEALYGQIGDKSQFTPEVARDLTTMQEGIGECLALITAQGNPAQESPEWLNLAEQFGEVYSIIEDANGIITGFYEIVEKAKTEKSVLVEALASKVSAIGITVEHKDVAQLTKTDYATQQAEVQSISEEDPKSDAEWYMFMNRITNASGALDKISDKAREGIEAAETRREQQRQATTTRTTSTTYSTSTRSTRSSSGSSRSSGGSSFGGFGGGRSGGGGASRKG